MIEEKSPHYRIPIKSPLTGKTVALMSEDGLEVWSKLIRQWETYPIEYLLKLHQEALKQHEQTA